jgi:tetratricopeptide (TPR) repeat protein
VNAILEVAADPQREATRLLRAGDWANALIQIDRVLEAEPAAPQWLLNRAQCLLALGRRTDAIEAALASLSRSSTNARLLDALGSFFSFVGDQQRALEAFDRAVSLAPDNPHFIFNRATVRRYVGELAAAEADYDRVIALRPTDFEAYRNRSDLRAQTARNNHVVELERLVANGFPDWHAEVQIRYSLAKEYEDLGEYAKSFEHLRLGAMRRRANLRYDVANDVATVQWIIEAFPAVKASLRSGPEQCTPQPGAPQPSAGTYGALTHAAGMVGAETQAAAAELQAVAPQGAGKQRAELNAAGIHARRMHAAPIFIVGLPRSGTTLVDRILGSHSEVRSAGELNDFALALVARVRSENNMAQLGRRDLVARSAHIDFAALGREYLARARAAVGDGRFTDKMPLNYLYCGLIRCALPEAKIVHLTRHPMAACYAMYKTLFKDGYPFSYDLDEIAQYYVAYRRLMDHWCDTMPGAIHEVSYESLVADQAAETRKLLAFCDLEWQDACLQFHRNPAATTTASAAQVRRPIYDSSVAQWRHYAAQLAGLRAALESAGITLEAE